jgi:predicted dinucleotide-binding enzyme
VQRWAPAAKVVKTLNTTGFANMADARFPGGRAVMFYCGDDAAAKHAAHGLVGDLGFEAVDAGALAAARLLEPLAMLWISLAMKQGLGRDFAFALLRR